MMCCAAVTHSLDLELSDEPLYLLASIHLQLGQLEQQQGSLDAAEQQNRSALKYFPRFVAALSALGQVHTPPWSRSLHTEGAFGTTGFTCFSFSAFWFV
jgi:hypothetical protein